MFVKDNAHSVNGSIVRDLVFPLLVWVGMMFLFLNIKHIPYDFSEREGVVVRFVAKFIATIAAPLLIINLVYKNRVGFGIYLPSFKPSLGLSFRAFTLAGPACMTFLLIGALGWGFEDWKGAATLSLVFGVVTYQIPSITSKLPNGKSMEVPNNKIYQMVGLSALTLVLVYFTHQSIPVLWKIFYYIFIVAFGEELFFRGYIQSSANRYFGKQFSLYNVKFGWGLILAVILFGLSYALVTTPPTWPWAVWTAILGLAFGYIREKDGSVLAAVMLHAMIDLPLAFMS